MLADRCAVRREKLLKTLHAAKIPALLVTNETNVSYLTGFRGDSSRLLMSPGLCVLISDGRYTSQIAEECPGLEASIRPQTETIDVATARVVKRTRVPKIGIEADHLTVAQSHKIEDEVKHIELIPTVEAVEELRQIKDADEIAAIREAIRLAEKGFEVLKAELRGGLRGCEKMGRAPRKLSKKPGASALATGASPIFSQPLTERQVANDLEYRLRSFGARGCSFPPIVAVGKRAALPHARPTAGLISDGDFVLVDWGAEAPSGYRSDLTRILATAKLSPKLERVYGVVLKAQQAALRGIRPGAKACDVDAIARRAIDGGGFGKRFTHGLGHGIGLDIHEGPRLSASSEATLKAGMVVTVEPGVYIEGWGGVRIEDDVLVTRDGCEVLSSAPKELSQISVG